MFTGIITHIGTVISPSQNKLFIKPKKKLRGIKRGESVAVNGCCLTVTSYKRDVLNFDVSEETFSKTALSSYQPGMIVNLEPSLRVGDRLGGHFVLGHVDGTGKIAEIKRLKGSWRLCLVYPKKFSRLLIEKGSVAVDGISLTVCDLAPTHFAVHIVPHTWKCTNLNRLRVGQAVNLEFDMLGKYVGSLFRC